MKENKRVHKRIGLPAKVKLRHPLIGEVILNTLDVSDGGVYIKYGTPELLPIGSEAKIQVINGDMEMPVLTTIIVRHGPDGIGVKFKDQDNSD